ncbi:MAG: lysophospholipid acyltransferase family protein [Dehalococcoidia bacterium]|nr:lysophospholipid acyltransferase family protein [Dehalococcoidia bacterium]
MKPFYDVANLFTRLVMTVTTDSQVTGRGLIPKTGALILVSNHLNNVDPPVLSACFPRRIVFMAKEELYNARNLSGFLARRFDSFPVRRGAVDRQALKQALQVLSQGKTLGLFPEGTRSPNGQLQPAQMGAAWIALESAAAIQPVAIRGTEGIRTVSDVLARPHIRVAFGSPFHLPPFPPGKRSAHLGPATEIIMESIAALLPEHYRGAYRGTAVSR